MPRKVIDIFQPEKKPLKKEGSSSKKPKKETLRKAGKKPSFSLFKKLWFWFLIIFIAAFIFAYFNFSKAKIEVWPKTEVQEYNTQLTVDKSITQPDFPAKFIPGQIVEKEKILIEKFPATGKILKEGKAEGQVKVFNNYSTSPQVLIATTRFISASGLVFRTPIKVTIPGGHYEKGKFVPGEIEIKLVADKPGPEYNIKATKFSIPGFVGTDKYTKFYAESLAEMTGGFSQEFPQVLKRDLESAEETLAKKTQEELEQEFKEELKSKEVSNNFIFLEKAILTETVEKTPAAKVGDEVAEFDFKVKAKSQALIFKKEDFNNFIKDFIYSQLPEETKDTKKINEAGSKADIIPEIINIKSGKIILSLNITAKIYSKVDENSIKNALIRKSGEEAKTLLESQPEIQKAAVDFWPVWVRKVPEDLNKIEFKLNLD